MTEVPIGTINLCILLDNADCEWANHLRDWTNYRCIVSAPMTHDNSLHRCDGRSATRLCDLASPSHIRSECRVTSNLEASDARSSVRHGWILLQLFLAPARACQSIALPHPLFLSLFLDCESGDPLTRFWRAYFGVFVGVFGCA